MCQYQINGWIPVGLFPNQSINEFNLSYVYRESNVSQYCIRFSRRIAGQQDEFIPNFDLAIYAYVLDLIVDVLILKHDQVGSSDVMTGFAGPKLGPSSSPDGLPSRVHWIKILCEVLKKTSRICSRNIVGQNKRDSYPNLTFYCTDLRGEWCPLK